MNNFFRYVFQALSRKYYRSSAPIVDAPETTTIPQSITLTETVFPFSDTTTALPTPTTSYACGSGVRFSGSYTISASSAYTWVRGPWMKPGCWAHVQASGNVVCSLSSGVTGKLYPEGYYGNTVLGTPDPEATHSIAEPWLTQTQYPNSNFLTLNPRPYGLIVCLEPYSSSTGNSGAKIAGRNLFSSWAELYTLSSNKPTPSEGGYLWFALNHNSSGVSGTINLLIDIYYECNTIDIPITTSTGTGTPETETATTDTTSSSSSTTTSSTTTSSSTTATDTPDTTTLPHIPDTSTLPGEGWGPL